MAFISDSRGTELATSACRIGLLIAQQPPLRRLKANMCHTSTRFEAIRTANPSASASSVSCVAIRSLRRSTRSASTPADGAHQQKGQRANPRQRPHQQCRPRQLIRQPAQRDRLHPVARTREERAGPQIAEVTVLEGGKCLESRVALSWWLYRAGSSPVLGAQPARDLSCPAPAASCSRNAGASTRRTGTGLSICLRVTLVNLPPSLPNPQPLPSSHCPKQRLSPTLCPTPQAGKARQGGRHPSKADHTAAYLWETRPDTFVS